MFAIDYHPNVPQRPALLPPSGVDDFNGLGGVGASAATDCSSSSLGNLIGRSARQPLPKYTLSISWKIDHFLLRDGVIRSVMFASHLGKSTKPTELWSLELRLPSPLSSPQRSLAEGDPTSSEDNVALFLRLEYSKHSLSTGRFRAGVITDYMEVKDVKHCDFMADTFLVSQNDKEFMDTYQVGFPDFMPLHVLNKKVLGLDSKQREAATQQQRAASLEDQQIGTGYLHLYVELILHDLRADDSLGYSGLVYGTEDLGTVDDTRQVQYLRSSSSCVNQLVADMSNLLTSATLSDVTLIISDDDTTIKAHKAILAGRSPVFHAMFGHEMEESHSQRVELRDIGSEVAKRMVKFLYTGVVDRLDEFAEVLLPVADKYDVRSLVNLCEESLCFNLNVENVIHRLILSDLHNLEKLKRAALGFIEKNIFTVRKTSDWQKAQRDYPTLFLSIFPFTEHLSIIVSQRVFSF